MTAPRFASRCIHWDGRLCRAGLNVDAVRDAELRLPCVAIAGVHGAIDCDERVAPRPPANQNTGALARALDDLTAGTCPTCRTPITREQEVGGAIYAVPCQHRIGRSRSA